MNRMMVLAIFLLCSVCFSLGEIEVEFNDHACEDCVEGEDAWYFVQIANTGTTWIDIYTLLVKNSDGGDTICSKESVFHLNPDEQTILNCIGPLPEPYGNNEVELWADVEYLYPIDEYTNNFNWAHSQEYVIEVMPLDEEWECEYDGDCDFDEQCEDHDCQHFSCGYCEYIDDHECEDYECCQHEDCQEDEQCLDHECVPFNCIEGDVWYDDCNDGTSILWKTCQNGEWVTTGNTCASPSWYQSGGMGGTLDDIVVECDDPLMYLNEYGACKCPEGYEKRTSIGNPDECVYIGNCNSTNECLDSQACQGHFCVNITCVDGYVEDHICIPYECNTDTDCNTDEICESHGCEELFCDAGDIPYGHECVDCLVGMDCASNEKCVANDCVLQDASPLQDSPAQVHEQPITTEFQEDGGVVTIPKESLYLGIIGALAAIAIYFYISKTKTTK